MVAVETAEQMDTFPPYVDTAANCETCLPAGMYPELQEYYPGVEELKVEKTEIKTEIGQYMFYNFSDRKLNIGAAKAIISFWEKMGENKQVLQFVYNYPKTPSTVQMSLNNSSKHVFIITVRDMIAVPQQNVGHFKDGHTVSVIHLNPLVKGKILNDEIGYNRDWLKQAKATFGVATCEAILGDGSREDINTTALCQIMGNSIGLGSGALNKAISKTPFDWATYMDKQFPDEIGQLFTK